MRSLAMPWGRSAVAGLTLASGALACEVETAEHDVSVVCRGGDVQTAAELAQYESCLRITGDLQIFTGPDLSVVELPNLIVLDGTLMIYSSGSVEAVEFPRLQTAGAIDLSLAQPEQLRLPALEHVRGMLDLNRSRFAMLDLPKLRHAGSFQLSGPVTELHAPVLETVGEWEYERHAFSIEETRLTVLELPALRRLDASLTVSQNVELEILDMPRLGYAWEPVELDRNTRLPTCMAERLAAQLARGGYDGPVLIASNDDDAPCPLP
ncbi:MAG: hypothetical protein HOV80_13645 [Polyangiaceae bacterium]|nr:hypothetical protein [Polyangiaceae bacterium]